MTNKNQSSLFGSELGVLAIYSLGDVEVTEADLAQLAKTHGVSDEFLPPSIRKVDAFRRATGNLADKKRADALLVREVTNDRDFIVRIIEKRLPIDDVEAEEIKAGREGKLAYQHIGTLVYNKTTHSVDYNIISKCAVPLIQKAIADYNKLSQTYTIEHIRKMVQNTFVQCCGITYRRNGGVAFIPEAYASIMRRMADLIYALGQDCIVDLIDVNDNPRHRADIEGKVGLHVRDELATVAKSLGASVEQINSADDLNAVIAEMTSLLKHGKLSSIRVSGLVDDYRNAARLVKEYSELLGANMDAINAQLELGQTAALEILTKVQAEEDAKEEAKKKAKVA